MEAYLGVSYKLAKSEKFEEFMKALGVNLVLRKIANTTAPTIKLTLENDKYTFHTLSTFRNTSITFRIGEEFEEETLDGRKVKSIVTFESNKMIQTQKGEHIVEIIREFSPNSVIATFKLQNITCRRIYERVKS